MAHHYELFGGVSPLTRLTEAQADGLRKRLQDDGSKLPVYVDRSLQAFEIVYPAGGSLNTSVEVTPERLFDLVGDRWVDMTRLPEEASGV